MSTERTPTSERIPAEGGRNRRLTPVPRNYGRLEQLYEIQTVLARSTSIEQDNGEFLSIMTRGLRLRSVVLLDTTAELDRTFTWAALGIGSAEVEHARDEARKALGYLARASAAPAAVVRRSELLPGGAVEQKIGARAFVTLPLVLAHGGAFGVLQVEGAAALDERDLLFISAVANQLAIALDRQHTKLQLEAARAEAEEANRSLRDLQAISKAALEGSTLDESLTAVLRALSATFDTDVAAVLLMKEDGKTLWRRASIGLEDIDGADASLGSGAAGRIAATRSAMFFDDLDEVEGVSSTLRTDGVRSLIGAPMFARNRLVGVVHVACRVARGFTHDELQLLQLVADRIGTIIDNATLYEQALSAIASRDAVMGFVSHDLRNPLNAILLSTCLLPAAAPRLAKPVAIIKRSAERMLRMIDDLLNVGSIEAGRLSIETQPEESRSLIAEAVEAMQPAVSEKSVRLETRLPAQDIVVACDRGRIMQVLTNLLTNAIKFTPEGGSITVTVTRAGTEYARFSVEDTGCGIPEEDLPHVFDRYWQAKKTSRLGTGLGLAITKGIAEAHGGTVSVESRVGLGTTFSFTLPLARAAAAPSAHVDAQFSEHQASLHRAGHRTGHRVLVVDDEPNALAALAFLLKEEGFVVETATDGCHALPKVLEFRPDVLIVDVEMPGLKGPDLVRKVREDRPELPVILMTGHSDHVIATAQMELRASHIRKPIEIAELVSAIDRALEKER